MKIFTRNKIWSKLIIIFVLFSSLFTVAPKPVQAGIGGALAKPIAKFILLLDDGIVSIEHSLIMKQQDEMIRITESGLSKLVKAILIGIIIVAAIILIVMAPYAISAIAGALGVGGAAATSAGAAAAIGAALKQGIIAGIIKVVQAGIVVGAFIGATQIYASMYDDEVNLPLFSIAPETIIENKIPMFDVNFFHPKESTFSKDLYTQETVASGEEVNTKLLESYLSDYGFKGTIYTLFENESEIGSLLIDFAKHIASTIVSGVTGGLISQEFDYTLDLNHSWETDNGEVYIIKGTRHMKCIKKVGAGLIADYYFNDDSTVDYSDENFGVDVERDYVKFDLVKKSRTEIVSSAAKIAPAISKVYYALRLLAIIGMMSVLVYIGIRITLVSTSSTQKAKYKQLLWDWLIGVILLFTMEYIMTFANDFVDNLSKLLSSVNPYQYNVFVPKKAGDKNNIKVEKEIKNYIEETGIDLYEEGIAADIDDDYIMWTTNLMGFVRMQSDLSNSSNGARYWGYIVLYTVMVIYSIIFIFTYMKRVIYLAFLTIISPLVALTYPIDKANDGKAQGFDLWFKEYMFNLLLQPMHLLLYTLLVSLAIEFATENIIYSLIAIGFIATAEKLFRQMFNFSKAHTPGILGGPAGAALTMTGMRWLFGHGPNGGKNKREDSSKSNDDKDKEYIKPKGSGYEDLGGLFENNDNIIKDDDILDNKELMKEIGEGNDNIEDGKVGRILGTNEMISRNKEDSDLENNGIKEDFDSENSRIKPLDVLNSTDLDSEIEGEESKLDINIQDRNKTEDIPKKSSKLKSALGAVGKGALAGVGAYGRGAGRKIKGAVKNVKPIRMTAKLIGGTAGAITFGTIGLAAGVASGDFSKTAQYTGIGVVGGYKLGKNTTNSVANAVNVEDVKEAEGKAILGQEKYNEERFNEYAREIAKQEETIKAFQEKLNLSRKDAKKKAEEVVPTHLKEGIKQPEEMATIEKFIEKHGEIVDGSGTKRKLSTKEGIQIKRAYDKYGIENRTGEQDRKKVLEQMKRDFSKQIPNFDERAAIRLYDLTTDFKNSKNN